MARFYSCFEYYLLEDSAIYDRLLLYIMSGPIKLVTLKSWKNEASQK